MPSYLALLRILAFIFLGTAQTTGLHPSVASSLAAINAYASQPTACPNTSLVRPASSIGNGEASYLAHRKPNADTALSA